MLFSETVYTNAAAGGGLEAEGCIVSRVLDCGERLAEEGEGWVRTPTIPEGRSVGEEKGYMRSSRVRLFFASVLLGGDEKRRVDSAHESGRGTAPLFFFRKVGTGGG